MNGFEKSKRVTERCLCGRRGGRLAGGTGGKGPERTGGGAGPGGDQVAGRAAGAEVHAACRHEDEEETNKPCCPDDEDELENKLCNSSHANGKSFFRSLSSMKPLARPRRPTYIFG